MSQHDKRNAIRILHAVGGMNHAGTETWLMHVLRHAERSSPNYGSMPLRYIALMRRYGIACPIHSSAAGRDWRADEPNR